MKILATTLAILVILLLISCEFPRESADEAPECWICQPIETSRDFRAGDTVLISASAGYTNFADNTNFVDKVDFFIDDSLIHTFNSDTAFIVLSCQYKLPTDSLNVGTHLLKVTATADCGLSSCDTISIHLASVKLQ